MKSLSVKFWCSLPAFVVAANLVTMNFQTPNVIADDQKPASTEEEASEKPKTIPEQITEIKAELTAILRTRTAREHRIEKIEGVLSKLDELSKSDASSEEHREINTLKSVLIVNLESLQAEGIAEKKEAFLESLASSDPELLRQIKLKFLETKLASRTTSSSEILSAYTENEELINSAPWSEKRGSISALIQSANFSRSEDQGVPLLEKAISVLESIDDPQAKALQASAEGVLRRVNLPGNEMELVGKVTLDGEQFDWSSYRGKVVLVDFWATWCGPCLAEFPGMTELYETYHDHGFEIIGVSIDSKKDALDTFMEKRKLPWTILYDLQDETKSGPVNARHYGINAIPRMILIGRDFKVISINARGKALEELLKKEFPDVSPKEPEANSEEDKSAKTDADKTDSKQS